MFSYLKRHLYLACVSLCTSMLIMGHALAQSTAGAFDDAQKLAQWGQNLTTLETRVIDTFDHPNFTFLLENLVSDEAVEPDTLALKFKEWVDFNDKEFADIRAEFEKLPDMPNVSSIEDSVAAMQGRKNGLAAMIEDTEASLDNTETLFHAAIYDDDVDLTDLSVVQITSIQRLLKTESNAISQSLAATGDDHPQIHLSEQSILTNEFLLPYLDARIKYIRGDGTLAGRKNENASMKKVHKSYKRSLKAGRKKQSSYSRRLLLAKGLSSSPDQSAQIQFARRIIDSYTPSFEVEDKILENLNSLLSTLKADSDFEDIEADIDIHLSKLNVLIDERLKYDSARQAIIANGQ